MTRTWSRGFAVAIGWAYMLTSALAFLRYDVTGEARWAWASALTFVAAALVRQMVDRWPTGED